MDTKSKLQELIEYRNVKGHVEVFDGSVFLFSADTVEEAMSELENEV